MRETRYRFWDKKNKIMVYTKPYSSFHYYMTLTGQMYDNGTSLDNILLQYTGLDDKNNKEIYDEDLIVWDKHPSVKWKVYWCQTCLKYLAENTKGNGVTFELGMFNSKEIEVVGNTYEN